MASEKKLLEELEKDTVDTSRWMAEDKAEAEEAFEIAKYRTQGGVAVPQVDGTLRAWHVTDDPSKVVEILEGKVEFHPREGDLCSGLYVSASPQYWRGRSQRRWDFMNTLSPEGLEALISAVAERVEEEKSSRYITESEYQNAIRILEQSKGYWQVLTLLADQPYNVNIQKIAKERGIADPLPPIEVLVDFTGRYLEFNTKRAIDAYMELLKKRYKTTKGVTRADLCDMLQEHGWDGIFTQSGFGTNPELVIWNPERIIAFGAWQRPGTEMSGPPERMVIWDPESRFEGRISINRKLADVIDREKEASFIAMTRERLGQIGMIVTLAAGAWVDTEAAAMLEYHTREDVSVENKEILHKIKDLSKEELQQLIDLLEQMLPVMA